ncbi:MAG: anthranilate synthase component I family protein [Sulfurovum sp.]|nr:MAG: anthranilate synthase component I family protein [Sulfurovum sp.]
MYKKFLVDFLTPVALFGKIQKCFPHEVKMLFESVVHTSDGNFSFIIIGAKERLEYKNSKTFYTSLEERKILDIDPFNFLQEYYQKIDKKYYQNIVDEVGFSFVDGFIGYIGYDMVKVFEPTLKESMESLEDALDIPDLDLVRPKLILAYSHKNSTLTALLNDESFSYALEEIENILISPFITTKIKPAILEEKNSFTFDEETFKALVDESKEMIRSGDVFQLLLSNRFTQYGKVDPFSFYRLLRSKNPSPYLFLIEFEDFSICGSSPEVMVRLTDGEILLRPIAGTRKRGKTLQRDKEMEEELLSDPKELAEHLMLIDLGRNDVGRVAQSGSVKVVDMMHIERYSHVMHIVSDVEATIREDKDMFDLFRATFTAGTMTGAPKIRAMELIAKYEKVKRSFYAGSIGYFSFNGNMDSAITIRTALIKEDSITLQAGGGVVADSKPELEYLEVKNKLGALLSTLKEMEGMR